VYSNLDDLPSCNSSYFDSRVVVNTDCFDPTFFVSGGGIASAKITDCGFELFTIIYYNDTNCTNAISFPTTFVLGGCDDLSSPVAGAVALKSVSIACTLYPFFQLATYNYNSSTDVCAIEFIHIFPRDACFRFGETLFARLTRSSCRGIILTIPLFDFYRDTNCTKPEHEPYKYSDFSIYSNCFPNVLRPILCKCLEDADFIAMSTNNTDIDMQQDESGKKRVDSSKMFSRGVPYVTRKWWDDTPMLEETVDSEDDDFG
jgi:hypothetical protein